MAGSLICVLSAPYTNTAKMMATMMKMSFEKIIENNRTAKGGRAGSHLYFSRLAGENSMSFLFSASLSKSKLRPSSGDIKSEGF
jgi:hypothetical protein